MLFRLIRHHHMGPRKQTFIDIHFLVSWKPRRHTGKMPLVDVVTAWDQSVICLQLGKTGLTNLKFMPYNVIADLLSYSSWYKVRKAE